MTGIDTNALVALAAETHLSHSNVVIAFEHELDAGEEIVLSPSIAAEFLHVVTDPRRLAPSLQMADAVGWLRNWSIEVAPIWLMSNDPAIESWLKWMTEFQLGRKRILDTQYAALLHARGVKRLLTNNPDDFRVFNVFEIITF